MFMSKKALCEFYEKELEDCREAGILFSLHVKATMMKVSHPIVFGHCVKIYYKDAFEKHGKLFDELGVNVNNGMVNLYDKIKTLPESKRDEIIRDLHACQEHRPRWPWSIRPRASPTSTRRTTSSSTPRCRR
jgi:isocitrate dehydrogenase